MQTDKRELVERLETMRAMFTDAGFEGCVIHDTLAYLTNEPLLPGRALSPSTDQGAQMDDIGGVGLELDFGSEGAKQ